MSKAGRILPLVALFFSAAFAGVLLGRNQPRAGTKRRVREPRAASSISPEAWREDLDFGPGVLLRPRPEAAAALRNSRCAVGRR